MWAGMGTLEEIERGTLNRFLTTPVSRAALMNANVVQNGISITVQTVIILLLGKLGGAHYPGGFGGLVILAVAAVLLGTVFGAFSNALGMLVRQRESIIGINTFLLLPLTFLSSAFMAPAQMPSWMRHIADFNPLNWGMVGGPFGHVGRPRLVSRPRSRRSAPGPRGRRGVALHPYVPLVPEVGVTVARGPGSGRCRARSGHAKTPGGADAGGPGTRRPPAGQTPGVFGRVFR